MRVGACPADNTARGCPAMRTTTVASDGTFDLPLPPLDDGARWHVAAWVASPQSEGCVFTCQWAAAPRNVVRSAVVELDANVDHTQRFSVSARIVDVFVPDRNGDPFENGGVQVTDTRCQDGTCPENVVPMFVASSPTDGAARLVVDPAVTYTFHGQAVDTGWPHDPAPWTNDGSEFWFSPDEMMTGAELDEGHTFYINGGP